MLQQGYSEYAPHLRQGIQTILYHYNNRWLTGALKLAQDYRYNLNILFSNYSKLARFNIGPPATVEVVPRYVTHSGLPEEFSDYNPYYRGKGLELVMKPTRRRSTTLRNRLNVYLFAQCS